MFGPPLRGDGWSVANGLADGANHIRVFVTGRRIVFGFDLTKRGSNGRDNRGAPGRNDSYYGYGTEVLAVANGTVVAVKDGVIENPAPPTVEVNWETVAQHHGGAWRYRTPL